MPDPSTSGACNTGDDGYGKGWGPAMRVQLGAISNYLHLELGGRFMPGWSRLASRRTPTEAIEASQEQRIF